MFENKVTIVGITKPVGIEEINTAGELVAYAARVSNPGNQLNKETAPKLLRYLVKNQHWSPFEMVSVVMEIQTTRDIARQILRHRSFSFQEFSQRYAQVNLSAASLSTARMQDANNRQSSIKTDDQYIVNTWNKLQSDILDMVSNAYSWAINNGMAKEVARKVLPEGLTPSTMYMSGSLRSWIHYIMLRRENGTQEEHRDIALKAQEVILKEFPELQEVFE